MQPRCANSGVQHLRAGCEQLVGCSVATMCKSTRSAVKPCRESIVKTCKSTCTHSNRTDAQKTKACKTAEGSHIVSILHFFCLSSTWKADATKLNPSGVSALWPGGAIKRLNLCREEKKKNPQVYCLKLMQIPQLCLKNF